MYAPRETASWLTAVCAASLLVGSAGAMEAQGSAAQEPSARAEAMTGAPAPLRPAVAPVEAFRIAPEPASGLDLPLPPDAPVTLTAEDRFRGALALTIASTLAEASPRLPRKERDAIAAFYAAAGHRPLWAKGGAWNGPANRLIESLKAAGAEGLDPLDYPIPAVAAAAAPSEDWAEAEVRLSAVAVLYARDARGARLEPARLSALLTPTLALPAADEVLGRLAEARGPGAALASYNPLHAGFQALKRKLTAVRENRPAAPVARLGDGPALKVGMRDQRVPLIRARFGLGRSNGDSTAYDERVASAVAAFQRQKGLPASGVLTPRTVAALSGPSPAQLEGDILANMERWRWLPAELGERHILVNIPEYRLRLFEGGDVVHQSRVVVGKAESQTPVFSDEMEHVIVNPSWTIPPSIMKNEILPGLARDPWYAERRGYEVTRAKNGHISVRQPPGERNALGFVKFIFPNRHAVYLHDTPSRHLFARERRAYSHGCVRVDQPFKLAEEILRRQGVWPEAKLRGLVGKGERYIRLREKLPVHLAYFTLAVDEAGELRAFDDLYGHHRRVRVALGFDA